MRLRRVEVPLASAFPLGAPPPPLPPQEREREKYFLRRRQLLWREAAVERLALGRHVDQEFWRREARAVFGFQPVTKSDKLFRAHEGDLGQSAAGERGEFKTQY